jgi:hypothetical protein
MNELMRKGKKGNGRKKKIDHRSTAIRATARQWQISMVAMHKRNQGENR